MSESILNSNWLNTLLAYLHIFSAIGWFGTALFMGMVMTPLLPRLSASTRSELLVNLAPKLIRYVRVFVALTFIFGLALWYSVQGGMPDIRTTVFGMRIGIGAGLAVLAYVIVELIVVRSQKGILRLLKTPSQPATQGPPPEMMTLQRRLRMGIYTVITLLSVVLLFMVAAAFYF